jgi:LCP family protein required for cell wall assembly
VRQRPHRVLRRATAGLSGVVLFGTVVAWVGWASIGRVEANLTVDSSLGGVLSAPSATPSEGQTYAAENVLIVGSDTRTGQGSGYGSLDDASGNGHSDTTLLLHISADRKSAFAVSIPRDSWVSRPGCTSDGSTDGTTVTGKFNAAFAVGGRVCVITAVKALTGVPINHFIEVEFKGFEAIVNALGGVTICSTHTISDPIRPDGHGGHKGSGLQLPKGESTLNGKDSLKLVRARYIGNGSDLERLDRQHKFLAAVIREASSTGLLTSPVKLFDVLSEVAKALTVDAGLSGDGLQQFLLSLQGLKPSDVRFYTVPVEARPGDRANVVWVSKDANKMWKAMLQDTAYPPKTSNPKPTATGKASPSPSPTKSASATTGSAADTACLS